MNNYQFLSDNENLGVTAVENLFINHYMPKAQGAYVKVYLYGLSQCATNNATALNNQELAQLFDMTEGDVIKAWEYWEEQNVLSLSYSGDDVFITYFNIVSKMLSSSSAIPNRKKETGRNASDQKSGTAEDPEAKRLTYMYRHIEDMYGSRTLTKKDYLQIETWLHDMHFTPETVVLLVEYSMNLINKKETPFTAAQITSYMATVAQSWYAVGIRDYNQAETYINESQEKQHLYYAVYKYLGLKGNPSTPHKKLMDKWLDKYHYDMPMITAAMERSMKTDLRYIDGILKRWFEAGHKTLADTQRDLPVKIKKSGQKNVPEQMSDPTRDRQYEELEITETEWLRSLYDDES